MSITLRQLRYFVSAVDTGKLSQAAAECGVSQSAITLAVKGLEDRMGVRLLDRHPSGVTLTYQGHRFVQKARDILTAVAEATAVSHGGTAAGPSGKLHIGTTYTVLGYFVGPYLSRFKRRFPDIELDVRQMDRPELEAALIDGSIDLAVMLTSNLENTKKIASATLVPSPRRLWLGPGHHLLQQKTFRLSHLVEEPYIMLTVDEAEQSAMRYWQRVKLKPNVVLRTTSVEAVRTLVASGMGITILSDMVYRPWSLEGERIEVRHIDDVVDSMDIGIGWRVGGDLVPAAQEFRNFLQLSFSRGQSI